MINVKFRLFQRKLSEVYFLPLDPMDVNMKDYIMTYAGEVVVDNNSIDVVLSEVFKLMNDDDRPTAHTHYSLSVNDIVEINGKRYICNFMSWTLM